MATDMPPSNDPGQQSPADTLIDELIADILNSADTDQPATSGRRGRSPSSGLFDTVRSTMATAGRGAPLLERLLLAEALADVLAEAIAPALADALAPRIMHAIGPAEAGEPGTPTHAARPDSSGRTRKANAR